MKRIGNLYDKIISLDNLHLADQKADAERAGLMACGCMTRTVRKTYSNFTNC